MVISVEGVAAGVNDIVYYSLGEGGRQTVLLFFVPKHCQLLSCFSKLAQTLKYGGQSPNNLNF